MRTGINFTLLSVSISNKTAHRFRPTKTLSRICSTHAGCTSWHQENKFKTHTGDRVDRFLEDISGTVLRSQVAASRTGQIKAVLSEPQPGPLDGTGCTLDEPLAWEWELQRNIDTSIHTLHVSINKVLCNIIRILLQLTTFLFCGRHFSVRKN